VTCRILVPVRPAGVVEGPTGRIRDSPGWGPVPVESRKQSPVNLTARLISADRLLDIC
jgi:hypothetical protein